MSTNNVYYYTNQQNKCHVHVKNTAVLFTVSIPPKFERKLRRHKQRFGIIATTVVVAVVAVVPVVPVHQVLP